MIYPQKCWALITGNEDDTYNNMITKEQAQKML